MLPAGAYTSRVRIERRPIGVSDETGNAMGEWQTLGSGPVACAVRPQFGRERLEAGRLESTTLATVTLRRSSFSEGIRADDRMVMTAGQFAGLTFNIRSIIRSMDGAELEFSVEEGVAT